MERSGLIFIYQAFLTHFWVPQMEVDTILEVGDIELIILSPSLISSILAFEFEVLLKYQVANW